MNKLILQNLEPIKCILVVTKCCIKCKIYILSTLCIHQNAHFVTVRIHLMGSKCCKKSWGGTPRPPPPVKKPLPHPPPCCFTAYRRAVTCTVDHVPLFFPQVIVMPAVNGDLCAHAYLKVRKWPKCVQNGGLHDERVRVQSYFAYLWLK